MNTLIIAEAGVNHNGSIKYARKLIDIAIEMGPKIMRKAPMAVQGTIIINKDLDIEDKSIFDKFLFKGSCPNFSKYINPPCKIMVSKIKIGHKIPTIILQSLEQSMIVILVSIGVVKFILLFRK